MESAEDLGLFLRAQSVVELADTLWQLAPERQATADRRGNVDRAQTSNVLVPDLAIDAAALDQTCLQTVMGLSKANEHVLWHGFGCVGC